MQCAVRDRYSIPDQHILRNIPDYLCSLVNPRLTLVHVNHQSGNPQPDRSRGSGTNIGFGFLFFNPGQEDMPVFEGYIIDANGKSFRIPVFLVLLSAASA